MRILLSYARLLGLISVTISLFILFGTSCGSVASATLTGATPATANASKSVSTDYFIRGDVWGDMDNDGVFDWPQNEPPYDHWIAGCRIYWRNVVNGVPGIWVYDPDKYWGYTTDQGEYEIPVYESGITQIGFIIYPTQFNRADYTGFEEGVSDWMVGDMTVIGDFTADEDHSANIRMWAYY
jgi:hypothetical protein